MIQCNCWISLMSHRPQSNSRAHPIVLQQSQYAKVRFDLERTECGSISHIFEPSPRVLRGPTLTRRDLLCRFRLSLPATGGYQLTWRQQSSTLVECANRLGGISYSGHATTFRRRRPAASQQILPAEIAFVPILVGIPGGMDGALMDVQVAPFSGALSWSTDHSVILCYYE